MGMDFLWSEVMDFMASVGLKLIRELSTNNLFILSIISAFHKCFSRTKISIILEFALINRIMEISLKIIKYRLSKLIEKLNWKSEDFTQANKAMLKLSGLVQLRQTINEFYNLNLFDNYVNSLKSSVIFTTGNDEMAVQHGEGLAVTNNLTVLKTLSENFLKTLNKTLPAEDINSVNIKLPPVNDFEELSDVSKKIHIALSQVLYNDEIKGQTKIVSVENGSIWFNVFVGSTALTLVASLAWSTAVIYKKMQEGKLLG